MFAFFTPPPAPPIEPPAPPTEADRIAALEQQLASLRAAPQAVEVEHTESAQDRERRRLEHIEQVCKERFEAFRTAGKASSIRVKRLPDMAKFYATK